MEEKKKNKKFLKVLFVIVGGCVVFLGAQYLVHKETFDFFNLKIFQKNVTYQKYDNTTYTNNIGKRYGDIMETYKGNLKTPSIFSDDSYIKVHSMDETIIFYFHTNDNTTVVNPTIDKDELCVGVSTHLGNLLGITDKSYVTIEELRNQISGLGEFYSDHDLSITVNDSGKIFTPRYIKGKYLNYNILIRHIDGEFYENNRINVNSAVYIMKDKIDSQYLYNN